MWGSEAHLHPMIQRTRTAIGNGDVASSPAAAAPLGRPAAALTSTIYIPDLADARPAPSTGDTDHDPLQ